MHAPLFFLDRPQYQHLRRGLVQRVRGAALAVEGDPIETISIREDGVELARAQVNLPCPELAVLALPRAAHSRFECEVEIDPARTYQLEGIRNGGDRVLLFVLEPTAAENLELRSLADRVGSWPLPPGELIAATQGGSDATSYADSAVSGFVTLQTLLSRSGHDPGTVDAVLDVGCGTGRLLLGWHAAKQSRRLAGVEIDPRLVAWSGTNLAAVAEWLVSEVLPPLPFSDQSFDVIQLVSVFTHLPLDYQRRWLDELQRLLRPNGSLIITLHGDVYARILLDPSTRDRFEAEGYAEVAGATPGANAFATFHSPEFARSLFARFGDAQRFERGTNPARPSLFPIAALQDVWVLRNAG